MVTSTYENVLRKLTKNLAKTCGKLYQRIFSTTTMPLLIPHIKQGEYCENFNKKSLGIHLLTYFLTFKNIFKGMLFETVNVKRRKLYFGLDKFSGLSVIFGKV